MKLIIQIPCYNEEDALPRSLRELPREVSGFDEVEWLVIDDGSTDRTSQIAREAGADHVLRISQNRGLARAFSAGLQESIRLGADVIVNTDADNQYNAEDIPLLTTPIVEKRAEFVIGERPIAAIEHFSPMKKFLQKLGSKMVREISGTEVMDAPSGFRALSRDAAMRINVFSEYTYTLETIIQAGQEGMAIESVPIRVNGETRPSRLVKSIGSYVKRSVLTMFRIFITYRPMRFFGGIACLVFGMGFLLGLRFVYFFAMGEGDGHVQSVILSALLMGSGLLLAIVAMLADLIAVNRRLMEKQNWRIQKLEERLANRREEAE